MSFRNAWAVTIFVALGTSGAIAQEEPVKESPIKVSARAKAACLPDALRLCRDAVPNVRNVLTCFGMHREEISNRCRVVLASYGLH